jgi:hypothetical protein
MMVRLLRVLSRLVIGAVAAGRTSEGRRRLCLLNGTLNPAPAHPAHAYALSSCCPPPPPLVTPSPGYNPLPGGQQTS